MLGNLSKATQQPSGRARTLHSWWVWSLGLLDWVLALGVLDAGIHQNADLETREDDKDDLFLHGQVLKARKRLTLRLFQNTSVSPTEDGLEMFLS